jgi:hypothetical protein
MRDRGGALLRFGSSFAVAVRGEDRQVLAAPFDDSGEGEDPGDADGRRRDESREAERPSDEPRRKVLADGSVDELGEHGRQDQAKPDDCEDPRRRLPYGRSPA